MQKHDVLYKNSVIVIILFLKCQEKEFQVHVMQIYCTHKCDGIAIFYLIRNVVLALGLFFHFHFYSFFDMTENVFKEYLTNFCSF
jgi:hypothetical protein